MKNQYWVYPRAAGFWTIVLSILYLVGAFGIPSESLGYLLLPLSPFQLILTLMVLLFFQQGKDARFWLVMAVIFIGSLILEAVGVATGNLFGQYWYGGHLGPKVLEVPWVIGVNWVLLVLCTGMISIRLTGNWLLRAVIGASLMVFLDLWIEPLASTLDFWHWADQVIPLQNYIAWWLAAFAFHLLFQMGYMSKAKPQPSNPIALAVGFLQLLFFVLLHLLVG